MLRTSARMCLVIIAIAQVVDVLSTDAVLAGAPGAVEGNPVVRLAMNHLGDLWWLPKAALAGVCVYFAAGLEQVRRSFALAIGFCAALAVSIVAWNLMNLS